MSVGSFIKCDLNILFSTGVNVMAIKNKRTFDSRTVNSTR